MELAVHTYGYIDAVYYVLNGIAMFRNSGFFTTLVSTVSILTGVYYAIKIAANGLNMRTYIMKTLGMLVFINSLLLPKAGMLIRDHVSKRIEKVDNLPLAFALPVGMLEEFGHLLTIGFEQVFAPIESGVNGNDPVFSYYNYGMLFGARLKQELSLVRIKDPEFVSNMRTFTDQCIVMPAMIGKQFTKEELVGVPDMWKLVSSRAGTLIKMDMYQNGKLTRLSCKEVVPYFEGYFTQEEERIINKYRDTEFAAATSKQTYNGISPLGVVFKNNIKAVYGGNYSATDALRQQMMVNNLSAYISTSRYGIARTKMQQERGWLLSGDTASYYLSMLLVLLKCITYAAFIFMVPIILLHGGMARYGNYITLIASLQLWASLNAVINMIMGTYSNVAKGSNLIISFASTSTINNHVDTIVTVAAGMQVVVPFLAFAIMQGGVAGISHLAGSVIGGLQSTAASIGGEVATGNVSMDNVSRNNLQRSMSSGFKHDHNLQYADNAFIVQLDDGSKQITNPNSNRIYQALPGTTESIGPASYRMEDSRHAQFNEGIQKAESLHSQDIKSYSAAESNAFSKQAHYLAEIAKHDSFNKNMNYEAIGEQGKALQEAVHYAQQLHDNHGYSWDQAAETALKASAHAGVSLGFKPFSIGASLSADGSISARNSNNQSVGHNQMVSKDGNVNESYNNLTRALSSQSFAEANNMNKSFGEDVRQSYEELKRAEEQVSMSKQNVDDWHQAKALVDSRGGTASKEMTEELINRCMVEWGDGDKQSIYRQVQKRHPEVMKVWNKMLAEDNYVQKVVSDIGAGRAKVSETNAQNEFAEFDKTYGQSEKYKIEQEPSSRVESVMVEKGFNSGMVKLDVELGEFGLKDKTEELIQKSESKYETAKHRNENEGKRIQGQVDNYRDNRKYLRPGKTFGIGGPKSVNKEVFEKADNKKSEE